MQDSSEIFCLPNGDYTLARQFLENGLSYAVSSEPSSMQFAPLSTDSLSMSNSRRLNADAMSKEVPKKAAGQEHVRTIFITGFPHSVKDRELHNLVRFLPGYEASKMSYKCGQAHGFVRFSTYAHACQAVEAISGAPFDVVHPQQQQGPACDSSSSIGALDASVRDLSMNSAQEFDQQKLLEMEDELMTMPPKFAEALSRDIKTAEGNCQTFPYKLSNNMLETDVLHRSLIGCLDKHSQGESDLRVKELGSNESEQEGTESRGAAGSPLVFRLRCEIARKNLYFKDGDPAVGKPHRLLVLLPNPPQHGSISAPLYNSAPKVTPPLVRTASSKNLVEGVGAVGQVQLVNNANLRNNSGDNYAISSVVAGSDWGNASVNSVANMASKLKSSTPISLRALGSLSAADSASMPDCSANIIGTPNVLSSDLRNQNRDLEYKIHMLGGNMLTSGSTLTHAFHDGTNLAGGNVLAVKGDMIDGNEVFVKNPADYATPGNKVDNPPCNTLFVGNLSEQVSEVELYNLFSIQPGYRQMKLVKGMKQVSCFVEFTDVASAAAVHQGLQGAQLGTNDRGGVRIQYSKNPFGRRAPYEPQGLATVPVATLPGFWGPFTT